MMQKTSPSGEQSSLSVIVPLFNQERWIERTISSVLKQKRRPDEIIVVDDGSTDDSINKLSRFGASIRLIRQKNAGASAARNAGLAEARGTYCLFLDGDDFVEGDVFDGAIDALMEADVAFSPCVTLNPDDVREQYFRFDPIPSPQRIFERWLDYYSQPPISVYWRTGFVRSIGGWDARVSLNDDGEFTMRAMLSEPRVAAISKGHGVYNAHAAPSLSKSRSPRALQGELDAMSRLIAAGELKGWSTAGFQRKIYIIARGAFQLGDINLGRAALKKFHSIGGKGHYGSFYHVAAASLMGLERKMKIADLTARLLRRGDISGLHHRH